MGIKQETNRKKKMKLFAVLAATALAANNIFTQFELSLNNDPQEPQVSNQEPQVSNQVEQVSNQVEQESNQTPQISNQVEQVSNQVEQVSNQRPQTGNRPPVGAPEGFEEGMTQ